MEKIGQILLREKLVTEAQLKDALEKQALFGGRIGSMLVELGALDEEQLGKVLGQRYRVPYVVTRQLEKVSANLLPLLPEDLASRHRAIPLKLQNKKLFIAMVDPSDFRGIETIGFQTGYAISPVVAPESVILAHLECYYGVPRKKIGVHLSAVPQGPAVPSVSVKPKEEDAVWLGGPEQAEVLDAWDRKLLEERQKPAREENFASPAKEASPAAATTFGARLAACEDRNEVAREVTAWLSREFRRGALFLVRRNVACGWGAVLDGAAIERFEEFEINLAEPSLLQTVTLSKNTYFGPVPPTPANLGLFKRIGEDMPEMVLAAPVLVGERPLAVIVVANRKVNLQAYIEEMRKLAHLLAMSLEILILQNKLSSMDL